jgi:hypothetical protein
MFANRGDHRAGKIAGDDDAFSSGVGQMGLKAAWIGLSALGF